MNAICLKFGEKVFLVRKKLLFINRLILPTNVSSA
jgi:hypothetical protein